MKRLALSSALVVLSALSTVSASANPAVTGAFPGPANRIVGLWSTDGMVGPCASAPFIPIVNTLLFHAGGTVVENPRFPPGGVPNVFGVPGVNQRGQGLGTWLYHPASERYFVHLQFDWFVDGVYHGYMTIDREMVLSSDGNLASGPVVAVRYAVDGNPLVQLCGSAESERQ